MCSMPLNTNGRVDERRRLGEGRHVGRRDDAVIDRLALRHVLEILLLETERRVLVQREIDRLAVIFLHQLFEPDQRLVEGVIVVELHGAVQRDGRLRPQDRWHAQARRQRLLHRARQVRFFASWLSSPVMPVPCKRNFGLADDAATTAKRMQNGAAVEANLSNTGQSARRRRADDCDHSGIPLRRQGPNRCRLSANQPQASRYPAPQLPAARLDCRQTPATISLRRRSTCRNCCAMSDPARSAKGGLMHERAAYRIFPSRLI